MVIPSRPLAQVVLTTRCPRCGVMNYGSSPSPPFCSVTTLGGKSMWFPMWLCVCVCLRVSVSVSVLARGWTTVYMHFLWKGWDHLTLMLSVYWRLLRVFTSATRLCSLSIRTARHVRKQLLWYNKDYNTICPWARTGGGGYTVCMKNAYESRFKWLFTHACANKRWPVNMWST